MLRKLRHTFGPLFLILACPPFAIVMWYTNTTLAGSFATLGDIIRTQGFFSTLYDICAPVALGSPLAWQMILIFTFFQLTLMRLLPGKMVDGPVTPAGNVPVYKANGVLAFFTTVATFCVGSFVLKLFPATIIYDNFGYLLGALNIASLLFCLFLYLKGRFAPSSTDAGLSSNFIFDYYWGTELYPRVLGWHLKKFITCRFGMMSWGIILISFAAAQQHQYGFVSNAMLVSVALQLIYIAKFYWWETGYLRSLDIMHDRAGFYICWGCMVWVPCIYTSPSMYLVQHPIILNTWVASAIFVTGVACILVNYLADRQRQRVRATGGQCTVWGKKPLITLATYTTERGETKENIILASGWWGISRHFHYLPEIGAAFFWSVPALFDNFAPYFYVVFLTFLLFDRAFRDDKRCAKKYGAFWENYCRLVPYKIIPFLV